MSMFFALGLGVINKVTSEKCHQTWYFFMNEYEYTSNCAVIVCSYLRFRWNSRNSLFANAANSDKRKICILTHLYFRSKSKIVFGKFDNQLIEWVYHVNISTWQEVMDGMTHLDRHQMGAISHTTFSNVFSWMKMYKLRSKFHRSLFPRVQFTIFQHWFR